MGFGGVGDNERTGEGKGVELRDCEDVRTRTLWSGLAKRSPFFSVRLEVGVEFGMDIVGLRVSWSGRVCVGFGELGFGWIWYVVVDRRCLESGYGGYGYGNALASCDVGVR